mmetsp:Transcript_10111/g.10197  ORF Transcript_10111/g.10197 Transcript_10111/m.10197 type:complete len:764 (+) Transcript_10111:179-2470(+)
MMLTFGMREYHKDIYYIFLGFCTAIICLVLGTCTFYQSSKQKLESPIVHNMNSINFKYSLVIEMSISIFIILDVIIGHVSRTTQMFSHTESGVIVIVLSLLLSSGAIFLYSIPNNDYISMLGIQQARIIIITVATCIIARKYDKKMWTSPMLMIFAFIGCFVAVLIIIPNPILVIVGQITGVIVFIGILGYIMRWFWYIRMASLSRKITRDEWSCTMITVLYVVFIIGISIPSVVYRFPSYTESSVVYLVNMEILFTFFITAVAMQQTSNQGQVSHKYQSELEFKRMFVRYISHEVRTPLNTAIIGLQVLSEELRSSHDSFGSGIITGHAETVTDIRTACDIAVNVLNELLTFDKLEAGTLMIEKSDANAVDLITQTVSSFLIQARQKKIGLSINNDCKNPNELLSAIIHVDVNKVAQIIRNLVSNALKFTPSEGSVDVNMDLVDKEVEGVSAKFLKLDVVDSGEGISEDNQNKLFKQIVQFNPAKLQGGGGSGLGLYISHGIAAQHNGSVSVYSKGEGFGSTFTLILPITDFKLSTRPRSLSMRSLAREMSKKSIASLRRRSIGTIYVARDADSDVNNAPFETIIRSVDSFNEEESVSNPRSLVRFGSKDTVLHKQGSNQWGGRYRHLKILVVDDTAISRKMQCRLLKTKFDICEEAEDGAEAVQKVSDAYPVFDLVLMDANMPVMSGLEASRHLRDNGYEGIIIGVTGNVTTSDIEDYIGHGANAVLAKPLDIHQLETAVNKLFVSKRNSMISVQYDELPV